MLAPMPRTEAAKALRWRSRSAPRRAVAALLLAWARPLAAAPPLSEIGLAQLGRESWTREVGLAGNWVRDIVRGADGFLWVATAGGLSRFDGRNFVNYTAVNDPELPSSSVAALAVGSAGRLWIGLEHGGLRVLVDGRLRAEPVLAALPEVAVRTLLETPDGTLWIGTSAGLWRLGPDGLEQVSPSVAAAAAEIRRLAATQAGEIWVRTVAHGLWRVRGRVATLEPDVPGCQGLDLALTAEGRLFTSCEDGIWERSEAARDWARLLPAANAQRLFATRDGALWFQSAAGLARWTPHGMQRLAPEQGVGDSRIRAFFEDDDAGLWVGTFSAGLSRLRRGAVAAIGAQEGLDADGTTAVAAGAGDGIWIGTHALGAYLWSPDRGVVAHWTAASGLPSERVWAIAAEARRPDRVWFGTAKGLALLAGGRLSRVALAPGREEDEIGLLYADPAAPETLWACAGAGGIHELRQGRFHALHGEAAGLAAGRVRALGRERDGTLLAGGDEGLFRFDGQRWRRLELPGVSPRVVRAWTEDGSGALWIASESSGLLRWSGGRLVRLGAREGLPFDNIYSLELDRGGGLWFSGDDGLVRLRLQDFERWADGQIDAVPFELLAARDGLRDQECNGWGRPASARLADGTLIYPTIRGIAWVDPAALAVSELSPSEIYVDRAWSDDRELDVAAPLELSAKERRLRLRFGAQEFLRPESVVFRYRLEGASPTWLPAVRRTEAVYSYLKPGRYRFRVQARLPGQDWVEAATAIPITVAPRLIETAGFRLGALALALALGMSAFRWRTRVERAHAAAIEREREFLREVIDTSPNPIFVKGRDLAYTLANRAAAAFYGLEPEGLVGRSDAAIAPERPGTEAAVAADREVLESGEERVLAETSAVDAAGRPRWFRVVKRPLRGASGEVEQVIGTSVDVTDFKLVEQRLRAREAELRANREELRQLARQLIRAQEEERRRLAREIHDDLAQRLAGLAMLTGSAARTMAREHANGVEASLEEIGHELGRLASDTQALARDLHPSLLENLGLQAALRSECSTFGQRAGLEIRFACEGIPEALSQEVSLTFYRIAQEALRNVAAHAGVAEARVELAVRGGDLVLTVEDSGSGIEPAARAAGAGLGLASMTERARLIGAEIAIESPPGQGTRIEVRAPLAREAGPLPV